MNINIKKQNIIGMIEAMNEDTEVDLARQAISMIFTLKSVSREETLDSLGKYVEAVETAIQ
jgi:hypothetical protein